MKWNRFTIKTKTDAEDMIICTLAEIGVEGAEIQDHQPLTEEDKAQMFVDIMPEGPEDDGVAYYEAYIAIKNVNKELGLPDSVLNDMERTTSADGKQTAVFDNINVSWRYHPDKGLEVT